MSDHTPDGGESAAPAAIEDIFETVGEFESRDDSQTTQAEIAELKGYLAEAGRRGLIDSDVRRLQARDAVEAFVGSVIFASPLLVEDGVFDIADYLFGVVVAGLPVALIANTLFVVTMTYALVEWTGRDREETQLLFGRIPTRVVMILVVSLLTAAILMTVWGRVENWQSPVEAIARINVIWTVGSLGAALGDIISERDVTPTIAEAHAESTGEVSDGELVDAIHDQFADLEATLSDSDDRQEVRQLRERTVQATVDDGFGDHIHKYTGRDIAEAFVGSIFFSVPFLVEDGVFDVAAYFLAFRVGDFPVFFLVNSAVVLLMVTTLVYWAGPQNVQMSRPIFGIIPRRMVGIAVVAFLTAAALMTLWGRVDEWRDPMVAVARISVVWTVAAFGAALGDILPGESSGDDINDDIAELGDRIEDLVD